MRKLKLLFLSSAVLAFSVSGASAQACLGLPSFENGSVHLNARSDFPEGATSYAAGLGTGRPNNLFANFGGGQVKFDDLSAKQTHGFLEFGYQLPAGPAQICPVAGGYMSRGPNDDAAGLKSSAVGGTGGVAAGIALRVSSIKVIPNLAAMYDFTRATDEDSEGKFSQDFKSASLSVGLGLVFFDRLSIQPLASIPLTTEEGLPKEKVSYGIFASVSFPWKAQEN